MEFKGESFNELKAKYRTDTGKLANGENYGEFLSFVQAHQTIVIAERIVEISGSMKVISDNLDALLNKTDTQ